MVPAAVGLCALGEWGGHQCTGPRVSCGSAHRSGSQACRQDMCDSYTARMWVLHAYQCVCTGVRGCGPGGLGSCGLSSLTPADTAPAVARELASRVTAVSGVPVSGDQAGSFVEVTGCSGAGLGQAPRCSYPHTHRSHACTYTLILIPKHTLIHTHTHIYSYTHPHTLTPMHTHTCTRSHRLLVHTRAHPLTHVYTLIHSLTRTHAQAPAANRNLDGWPPCPGWAAWTQVRIAATPSPHRPNAKLHVT